MAGREVSSLDSYSSKLAKLIPAEVTAAYLAVNSLVPVDQGYSAPVKITLIVLTVFCPLYLWVLQNVRDPLQLLFTTGAFPLWALNISYPRSENPADVQIKLGVALILVTLVIPLIPGLGSSTANPNPRPQP
jgi:hypothetical protein